MSVEIRDGKKILVTPISADDLKDIKIGDIVYLSGSLTTCRDVAHRRVVEEGREIPVDVRNNAILHAGPIIRPIDPDNGKFEMVSVGPTTSMRMEKFEYDFVKITGVRVIVGKGGMKENTSNACKDFGAIHCVIPAGNAVVAAVCVEEIVKAEWRDLGMPETLWNCRVKEFGPLIVSIDSQGRNYFEEKKIEYNRKKDEQIAKISEQVKFIK
ncbi:MAG: L(+)-tartrate dehydratase subunit beta [Synergistaceae bacterium]|nr:L(+)-tartrate dehydratase subunit beta [Synergistaceae bacterium]